MTKYLSLGLWIIAFEAVSFGIGTATQGGVDGWYASLARPPLVPPNIAFPIMWSTLYALIAATGWSLWQKRTADEIKKPLRLFILYMVLNWSWTFIFFSLHEMLVGLIWIGIMNVIAVIFIVFTWRPLKPAALMMIPPTLWTCFAMYLNAGFWWLNS